MFARLERTASQALLSVVGFHVLLLDLLRPAAPHHLRQLLPLLPPFSSHSMTSSPQNAVTLRNYPSIMSRD